MRSERVVQCLMVLAIDGGGQHPFLAVEDLYTDHPGRNNLEIAAVDARSPLMRDRRSASRRPGPRERVVSLELGFPPGHVDLAR